MAQAEARRCMEEKTSFFSGTLLTQDRQNIAYHHYRCGFKKIVVIAHGFYNSKDAVLLKRLADRLREAYDVFLFDFRGHGKSTGCYTWTSREGRDLSAVLDFLKGTYEKTGLVAFSLGGSIAINTLGEGYFVDSLVCVSAVSDPGKIDYQFWKLNLRNDLGYTLFTKEGWIGRGVRPGPFWLKKDKPLDRISDLSCPILYIHGDKDWVVRPWHSQALYQKTVSKKKMTVINKGSHAEYLLKDHSEVFLREVERWLQETL